MAFADGLGREDKVFAHIKRIDVSRFDDITIFNSVKLILKKFGGLKMSTTLKSLRALSDPTRL
ncbi:MAG TPA: hypothetical protein VGM06_24190, partial [Polyangiaceae bacterium]